MPTSMFLAQYTPDILPTIEGYEPISLVKDVIAWAIIAAGALCIAFIVVGGISFILSGGQEDKIKQAVNTIRYAIIGFIVVLLSVFMVSVITYVFQIPKFIEYRDVYDKIKGIGNLFQPRSESDYQ